MKKVQDKKKSSTKIKELRAFALRLFWGFPFTGFLWLVIYKLLTEDWRLEIFFSFLFVGWIIALTCAFSIRIGTIIRKISSALMYFLERNLTRLSLISAFSFAVLPFGLIRRLFGKDLLLRRSPAIKPLNGYRTRTSKHTNIDNCHEQF